jgi:hypothetical protein
VKGSMKNEYKTIEFDNVPVIKVEKIKNGKPTIISIDGERFVKESPYQGKKANNPKGIK